MVRSWFVSFCTWVAAVVILLPFAVSSCCPKVYPSSQRDSVRVEIRERVILDSVYFTVEKEVEKVIVRDSSSHLENKWACSDASVDSLGFLHHSLESIPQKIYVPYTVEVHDTTVVEHHAETIVQEVNRLTKWQTFWLMLGKIAAVVFAVSLAIMAIYLYFKLRI